MVKKTLRESRLSFRLFVTPEDAPRAGSKLLFLPCEKWSARMGSVCHSVPVLSEAERIDSESLVVLPPILGGS